MCNVFLIHFYVWISGYLLTFQVGSGSGSGVGILILTSHSLSLSAGEVSCLLWSKWRIVQAQASFFNYLGQ
jgi:hypothetical protein